MMMAGYSRWLLALLLLSLPARAADVAISALPAVTSLADADILPVVASGATSKITAANLRSTILGGGSFGCLNSLAGASGKVPYFTGVGTCDVVDSTAGGRLLLNLTFAQGDLLYASAAGTPATLAKSTSATRYISNTGSSNNPAWAQVDLTNGTTGTLPTTSGGSGLATYTQGDLLYSDASNSLAKLAKSATATRYLGNTGTSNNPAWAQIDLSNGVTATLPATNGGLGFATGAVGDLPYINATTPTFAKLAAVATGNALISGGTNTAPSWGKIGLTTHVSGTLAEGSGGTNQSTYATGDLLQATASNTLGKLAAVATGNALISGGVTTASSWGKIGLTTHVTGTLGPTNGGSGLATYTQGDILYSDASNSLAKLAKSASATRYLANTGTSNNPAWAQVDLSNGVTGTLGVTNGGTGGTKRKVADCKAVPPATLGATYGILSGASSPAENYQVWDFDAATIWYIDLQCQMNAVLPASTGVDLKYCFAAASATSGNVIFDGAIRRMDSAVDLDTTSFTYTTNAQAKTTATSATAGKPTCDTIGFTSGTQMNSAVAGDQFTLRFWRDASNGSDTMTGNARVFEQSFLIQEQ